MSRGFASEELGGGDILRLLDARVRAVVRELLPELLPPPAPACDEQYLTVAHAAQRFDVPEDTLRDYLKKGRLKKHVICGRVHVWVSEIVAAGGQEIESRPLGRAARGGGRE